MSLFSTLLRLQVNSHNVPLEDYLTELFGYCLNLEEEILISFLKRFKIPPQKSEEYYLNTQVRHKKLPHHTEDSIPDMMLTFENHVIFIENKVASSEGNLQLQRYAEHLDNYDTTKIKALIYITRDFDLKDEKKIFIRTKSKIKFIPLRWHQIFRFLQSYNDRPIIKEILILMKEKHLSSNNQFSPVDILTLTNFSKVRKMMSEVIYNGKVGQQFEKVVGKKPNEASLLTQIKYHDRYVVVGKKKNNIKVYMGFLLNTFNEIEYPDLIFKIEITPSSKVREVVINKMKAIASVEKSKWAENGLDDPKEYSGIVIYKSMQSFLNKDDQIEEMRKHFMDCLNEYEKVMPQLKEYL
jgi:hypothetical protein